MAIRDIVQAAAGNVGESLYVEDVFSTWLYSGNASTQTINNGIKLGTASGGSVFFDGNGDRLALSTNTVLNLTGDFTIEFWMYPTLLDTYKIIFDTSLSGAAGSNMTELWIRNTGLIEYYAQGSILLSGSGVVTNAWQHVALVRNGSTQTIYLNGTSVASTTSTTTPNTGYSWYIGDRVAGAGSAQYPYAGYLSNFRIVKGTAVYTSNFTPPTEPLTAISGTSLLTCQAPNATTDYSANALPITVTNAIAQNGGGPFTDAEAGEGGLVWIKNRGAAQSHGLSDTARGAGNWLSSDLTVANIANNNGGVSAFTSTGFSVNTSDAQVNGSSNTYASWTFRKAEKFFDVVTYTGNGSSSNLISHNLGSTPGFIVIKRTNSTSNWFIYHIGNGTQFYTQAQLNSTDALSNMAGLGWTAPTSTTFAPHYIRDSAGNTANTNGATYVAYLFAHDAGGFGDAGDQSVISCGSYTGPNQTVTLGYEPQWIMYKDTVAAGTSWQIIDNMRGMSLTDSARLFPNSSSAEVTGSQWITPTATGFITGASFAANTFIYIAIRRGPMETPTVGTSVFSMLMDSGTAAQRTVTLTNTPDLIFSRARSGANPTIYGRQNWLDRLRGNNRFLESVNTDAENSTYTDINNFAANAGTIIGADQNWAAINYSSGYPYARYFFQRSPSFLDVVCYTGTGVARTINHNLGVVPELMIVKSRNNASSWYVWGGNMPMTNTMFLEQDSPSGDNAPYFNDTAPTASVFSVSSFANSNTWTYVAYLFASCAGVSKVGSYTGTGTTQQINCGFTTGSRFVLIKRTDNTGDWYLWDSARGIVAGNDPYLLLNTTAAEVTNTDYVDTYSAGFEISSTAPAAINANGGTFIFLAIA